MKKVFRRNRNDPMPFAASTSPLPLCPPPFSRIFREGQSSRRTRRWNTMAVEPVQLVICVQLPPIVTRLNGRLPLVPFIIIIIFSRLFPESIGNVSNSCWRGRNHKNCKNFWRHFDLFLFGPSPWERPRRWQNATLWFDYQWPRHWMKMSNSNSIKLNVSVWLWWPRGGGHR